MTGKTIYVGRKPVRAYVTAILTGLRDGDEVVLRARGRAITTAVDAAEVAKHRFMPDLKASIKIGTEELAQEEGGARNVSTIEITLKRSRDTQATEAGTALPPDGGV